MTDIEKADVGTPQTARKNRLMIATSMMMVVGAGIGGYYFFSDQNVQVTDNAYVNGHVVDISPQISGAISLIKVDNTDRVEAGALLVDIDQSDVQIELAAARAELMRTRRNIEALFTQQKQAESKINAERVQLSTAIADLNARKGLADQDLITKEELRHAADAVKIAEAKVDTAVAAQREVMAHIQGADIENHPEVLLAKERVEKALLNLKRSSIMAPVSGMVAQRTVQLGEHVQVGQKLMSIIPLDQMWIDANFKETQLNGICPGQAAEITVDSYGRKVKYNGQVQDIMVGSGSAFSVLPAQNATGNWIKVVQRVPVRIKLDAKQLAQYPLRIGLSAEVKISTARCAPAPIAKTAPTQSAPIQPDQATASTAVSQDQKPTTPVSAVVVTQTDGQTIERG
ncbi:membrane fusion protein (multidrug efflux system) [Acinetobacter calcoaceticus]|uniref:Membrane fusion protein (Multidrug efflux system) n=1 Tax=Acinetobacter calcoaceticus TaxID=471 RepID=A0A4R1XZP3_ACICA|nr:membrane fusion protein (multidrug efflux system) [Acinetobacter calcoaceticus]